MAITNVKLQSKDATRTTIYFDMNNNSDRAIVTYGPDAASGNQASSSLVINNTFRAELQVGSYPNGDFKFKIDGTAGNFPETPGKHQVITPTVSNITPRGGDVQWGTYAGGDSTVRYKVDGGSEQFAQSADVNVTSHSVVLDNAGNGGCNISYHTESNLEGQAIALMSVDSSFQTAAQDPADQDDSVEFSLGSQRVQEGGSTDISVTVKDKDGSPKSGVAINVAFKSSSTASGTLNPQSAATNGNGVATITFSGAQVTGNGNQGNAQVEITSGPKHRLAVIHVRK